ncbi:MULTISPECIES: phage tail tape measure protein [Pseudomonas]|uniref:phage tail tape measure protein n=1 Tax=Pseudomonas TaxID=286 RepID=UPI00257EEFCE|nr:MULTISPECIES: phage tail tape measure protein [Pseudomonas]
MADSDVQGMLVRIEATTAQLRQELARGETAVAKTSGQIDNSLGVVDKAFDRTGANASVLQRSISAAFTGMGLAATAAIAGLVAITTKTTEYAQEVRNLSTLSNTSTTEFQRMAAGARTVGVEQEKLADIYKDTTDRAGEFISRGGGEMADFFKEIAPRVGVTAQMFANLSGPQALQLYYNSLEKAGLNQQQMTTYMEAMADEATALIPLLRNNGAGFQQLGDQAETAGNILSSFQIDRLVQVNQSIKTLEQSFAGATRQLVAGMLPGIESVTQRLNAMSKNGVTEGLGAGIGFLADNLNILVAILGGKVTAAFVGYLSNLAASTAASVQSRSANIAQAASAVQVATANQIAAQSATRRAEKEAIAARGTAVQTQMSIQLAEARMAERSATAQVVAAQATLKSASTGVLSLLGGPAGIAALAVGAGIAFLTMRDNTNEVASSLDALKRPLKEVREEFRKLTQDQQGAELVKVARDQERAVSAADEAYGDFLKTVRQNLGSTVGTRVGAEFDAARASGKQLSTVVDDLTKRFNIPEENLRSIRESAGAFSTADKAATKLTKTQQALTKEMASGPTKPVVENTAGENAANTYLQQLEKQQHTLQDKTALEQADRFIIENKIKSESDLAAKIRERAKAIDALKASDKAATKGESEAERARKAANSALEQQVKTAQTSFDALKKTFDPVGAAADELKKKTEELDLLFQSNKISVDEYAKGLDWLKDQYDTTVASATGLSQAMQYQADLEKQLNNARASYDAMASSVGMGDKGSERAQARLDLERQTNDKILGLRTDLATATTEKQRQDLQKQIDLTEEYGTRQVQVMQEGWKKIDQAQSDWSNGVSRSWANYRDSAADVAGQTESLFSNALSSTEDAIVQFVKTGKLSFKSLADSVVEDLIRIQAKQALVGLASSAFSFLSGGSAALSQGTMTGFSEGSFVANAKGGVYDSPSLSTFSNGVYNTPQTFAFAKGAGIFAEAGPEAIMPLTRGADGSLGVRALGGGDTDSSSKAASTLAGVTQHFHFGGGGDAVSRAELKQAAQEGAQAGYQMVLGDLKRNGAARQLINRR